MSKTIVKTIAMYLPQFHELPENNLWWGKGFTEWTTVRQGKPLFYGHKQPKIPWNKNYYDLMDKEVLIQQNKIAKKYNIYGFCFYHYWFDNGKKILEKPVENLLMWKEIEMPFCFCWANQTWARTWSNVKDANAWSDIFEKEGDKLSQGILLLQKYGREKLWKKHFEYLLPFWSDKRYILKDNKPLLLIYKPDAIYSLSQMLQYWNELARLHGFDGIYVIGENCSNCKNVDGMMIHQPATALVENGQNVYVKNNVRIHHYRDVWERILGCPDNNIKQTYYMGFTSFDDTPRRGEKGTVVEHASPVLFGEFFQKLKEKSEHVNADYIFLNAWNEWGEGMYLEPDEENGYGFLEEHLKALNGEHKSDMKDVNSKAKKINRKEDVNIICKPSKYYMMDQWMYLRDKGKKLDQYLIENGFSNLAVYGYGDFGKHLINELEQSSLQICYVIDRRKDVECLYPVKGIEDEFEQVDAIIVTPFNEYEEILSLIQEKIKCPVISIEELILESM